MRRAHITDCCNFLPQGLPVVMLCDRVPNGFDLFDEHGLREVLQPIVMATPFYPFIAFEGFGHGACRIPAAAITEEKQVGLFAPFAHMLFACRDHASVPFWR